MANNSAKKNKEFEDVTNQYFHKVYELGYKDGYEDGVEDTKKEYDRAISEGTKKGSSECGKKLRGRKEDKRRK